MNDTESGACIRYVPGEIVALRTGSAAGEQVGAGLVGSHALGAALLASNAFDDGRITLELQAVVPGSEQWHLATLQRTDPQAVFSLNYLGNAAWDLFSTPSKQLTQTSWVKQHVDSNGRIQPGWPADRNSCGCVLVVDVSAEHCRNVMRAAHQGMQSVHRDCTAAILGIALSESGRSLAAVHDYVLLLLSAASQAPKPVLAVNMSVDFGQACEQSSAHVNGASTVCLSFPLFERVLAEAKEFMREDSCVPAFFAAAGNRLRQAVGWRLAYPAVRPEVIAVTSATCVGDSMSLSESVDCPAVHELKPCFAVASSDVERSNVSSPGTTSMACGWAAGRYAALADRGAGNIKAAPTLAKVAQLQARSKKLPVIEGNVFWANPGLDPMPDETPPSVQRDSLERLLFDLNQRFKGNEFLVTGSMAAVAALLKQYPGVDWTSLRRISAACGDVDLIAAMPLGPRDVSDCRDCVRRWLATWSISEHALDMAHRDSCVTLPTLSQAVIPAAQLAVTQDGIVDGHAGVQDIKSGRLRLLMPNATVWHRNPDYRGGIAGGALGVLVWVNTSLLLEIAATVLGQSSEREPGAVSVRLPVSIRLDAEALRHVEQRLTDDAATLREERFFPIQQRRLRPRLDRTHRLIRLANKNGLETWTRLQIAERIERAFFAGVSS